MDGVAMAEGTEESVASRLRGRVLKKTEVVVAAGLLKSWKEGVLYMEMEEEIPMVEAIWREEMKEEEEEEEAARG